MNLTRQFFLLLTIKYLVHTVRVRPELIEFYSQTVTAYLVPHLLNVIFFHFPFPKGKKKDKREMSINQFHSLPLSSKDRFSLAGVICPPFPSHSAVLRHSFCRGMLPGNIRTQYRIDLLTGLQADKLPLYGQLGLAVPPQCWLLFR